jgi:hypothetical protein
MNHWITSERLAADRHADFARQASGDARLRASRQGARDAEADVAASAVAAVNWFHAPSLLRRVEAIVRALATRSSTA